MTDLVPAYRPLLPGHVPAARDVKPRGGGAQKTGKPSRERQGERLDGRFDELERMLSGAAQVAVTDGVPAGDPELVIVFEVVETTADLHEAFRKAGLEALLEAEDEYDDDSLGDDFALASHPTQLSEPIKKFLHAAMANEEAVRQLLSLWARWKRGDRMQAGFGPFSQLFSRLHDVRAWGPADRVRNTGLAERLQEILEEGIADVPIQVELWPRLDETRRAAAEQQVRDLVEQVGGRVLRTAFHPQIGYHGIAAQLPTASMRPTGISTDLPNLGNLALLRAPEVLYVRPGGQHLRAPLDQELPIAPDAVSVSVSDPPLVAMLDGYPEINHRLLAGRVTLVDPDGISDDPTYTQERRRHGTMVASVLALGDLGASEPPASRRIVVRPILRPDLATRGADEALPWDELPPDLMIRAVRDLLGHGGAPGSAPTVRVINLSVADNLAQFDTIPSAWARAIDWLATEYGVTFVVSAGNHAGPLPLDADVLRTAVGDERNRRTAAVLAAMSPVRRLLPPAESVNAITVGASHADAAGDAYVPGYRVDLWDGPGHPSPISAHGRGVRRAIKPDIVAPGGRQLYSPVLIGSGFVEPARGGLAPGVLVAAPPDRTTFVRGTTFATAHAARQAGRIVEALQALGGLPDSALSPATKALLVHGARLPQGTMYGIATDRIFGNGALERDLSAGCLPSQATVLFTGLLDARQAVDLEFPFPEPVAGLTAMRRVTFTLAWNSPINWNHRQYRRAKLTVDGPREMPSATRDDVGVPYNPGRRGTVQHRCMETIRAFAAERLTFTVTCLEQAGGLSAGVPFALAVTLEVGADVGVDVYELVRAELRTQINIGLQGQTS